MTEKKLDILVFFQIFFAISVILIGVYGKVTENFNLQPLLLILMGAMLLIIGLREYKRTNSLLRGLIYLSISLFILFVAVKAL
ncbi:DUF3953 domain-containing protein [Lysinibacillus sp. NPDC097287]|uniref:DUF3953 domain-containing protein n=1 Tax=Lysinibacillus sp. NPDC097287 TaxID=3364144 RepID=UPI0037FE4C90